MLLLLTVNNFIKSANYFAILTNSFSFRYQSSEGFIKIKVSSLQKQDSLEEDYSLGLFHLIQQKI